MFSSADVEYKLTCQAGATVGDLKDQFTEEYGIPQKSQTFKFGFARLDDDGQLIEEFVIDGHICLELENLTS